MSGWGASASFAEQLDILSSVPPVDSIDEQAVSFFYRWDKLERPDGLDVIDFDLLAEADRQPAAYSDRGEAFRRASGLLGQADMETLAGQKVRAAHTLLRALRGEEISYAAYVEGTLGVTPAMISEDVLDGQFQRVTELLGEAGYPHTEAGVVAMKHDSAVRSEQIRDEFEAAAAIIVPRVCSAIGLDQDVDYATQFVTVDEYWSNWTATDPTTGGLLLQINTHPRTSWWRGKAEMLVLHEIGGHACQSLMWRHQIDRGNLARSAGLATVFGPEAFCLEGLAQSLSWFLPQDPLSEVARRALEMSHLGVLVWNNVHLMLNQENPVAVDDALSYAGRWAPGYKNEMAATSQAREVVRDPMLRTYLYAYGASAHYYRTLADGLDESGRAAFLHEVYSRPVLSDELCERIRSMTSPST